MSSLRRTRSFIWSIVRRRPERGKQVPYIELNQRRNRGLRLFVLQRQEVRHESQGRDGFSRDYGGSRRVGRRDGRDSAQEPDQRRAGGGREERFGRHRQRK